MKKSLWIFILAIILPSLILGWLALLSTDDQQVLVEKWTSELYQKEAESVATSVRAAVEEQRREFNSAVRAMIGNQDAAKLAVTFAADLPKFWQRKAVGFVLDKDGVILSPTNQQARNDKEWQEFLMGNSGFLCAEIPATVYWMTGEELNRPDNILGNKKMKQAFNAQAGQFKQAEGRKLDAVEDQATLQVAKEGADFEDGSADALPAMEPADPLIAGDVATVPAGIMQDGKLQIDTPIMDERRHAGGLETEEGADRNAAVAYHSQGAARERKRTVTLDSPKENDGKDVPLSKNDSVTLPSEIEVNSFALGRSEEASGSENGWRNNAKGSYRVTPSKPKVGADSPASFRPAAPLPNDSGSVRSFALKSEIGGSEKPKGLTTPLPAPAAPSQAVSAEVVSKDADQQIDFYASKTAVSRSVTPQRQKVEPNAAWSQLTSTTADFRALTEGSTEGVVSRFVQDKLEIIFWMRPSQAPEMIFGCRLHMENLDDLWKESVLSHVQSNYADGEGAALTSGPSRKSSEYVLALLDDRARPVITQPANEKGRDWKRPFVATEIGEILPHWEVALYLLRPDQLKVSARNVRRTLIFLIITALAAIGWGCWVVMADTRRQLVLAQKKTDFVSNVSHELKTPLTSIRMFAELMQSGNPQTSSKFPQYLRIIMVEAERLTRLINNVLDFAKIERRQKTLDRKSVDLHEVVSRVWEGQELHLRENGFVTRWEMAEPPYPVIGDEDALAQVLVNLISNAEKYSGNGSKEVELHTYMDGAHVCVSVLDRGLGVPNGEERKIFEAFYRAHDSLSSGIQGSGLGLTLAQRIVREQGGEIIYHPRNGGGSVFTLRMPLAKT